MLSSIVVIILGMLSICIAFPAQITSYNGIPNNVNYDRSPFVKIGDNHYLIETTEEVTWIEAVQQCRKKGGNLASIESMEEMKALDKHLLAKYTHDKSFWISGNDISEEGHFKWLSTGLPMEYTNWDTFEPNSYNGNEDCVQLNYNCDHFKFNDLSCTRLRKYICKADKQKEMSIKIW